MSRFLALIASALFVVGSATAGEIVWGTSQGGGLLGVGTLAEMNASSPSGTQVLWQQTDDNGTGDCATSGGSTKVLCQWTGAAWAPAGISSGIANVAADVAPTLGGNLDASGNDITGAGTIEGDTVLGAAIASQYATLSDAVTAACALPSRTLIFDTDVSVTSTITTACDNMSLIAGADGVTLTGTAGITVIDIENDSTTVKGLYITHAGANAANVGIRCADDLPSVSGCSDILITENTIQGVTQTGIAIDGRAIVSSVISDNFIQGWDKGIYCEDNTPSYDCNAVMISGNRIRSNQSYGIQWVDMTSMLTVTGNTIEGDQNVGILCDDGAGIAVVTGNHFEQNIGAAGEYDILRDDVDPSSAGGCAYVLIGNRFGANSDYNYVEDVQGVNKTVGFGNYWRSGWNITAGTTRPEWYPSFQPATMDSAGTYDTAQSRGSNYIATDCGTSFSTANMLPGDLCQDSSTGKLWYCKTPAGAGTNTGFCDADSELAPVQVTLVQADCSAITQAGTFCVDSDDNVLYYGNGSSAVSIATNPVTVPSSTTLPATCSTGALYMDTDATSGQRVYGCESANTWVLQGDGGGGGSGAFSDASDPVVLNSTTKDVVIGTAQVNTSKLTVDGDADQVQLTVQGNGTQTDSVIIVENSAGTETVNVEADGTILTAVGIDAIGAVDMDYGSADVTDHTFLTDGTGNAEIVLPTGSIGSTEILDGDILEADLKVVDVPTDEECLTYESTGGDFEWQACGSGSGAFSDAGDPIVQNTTTKDVVIGTSAVNTSKLTIDGDADQVQFTIQGNASQTDSIMIVEDSAGTEVINLDNSGAVLSQSLSDIDGPGTNWSVASNGNATFTSVTTAATTTPTIGLDDSDDAGSPDAAIVANCPTAGDCDISFQADSAGSLTEVFRIDTADDGTQSVIFSKNIDTGSLTIDSPAKIATSTGGALATNTITLGTAAADYDLPDVCDSATGEWATLMVRDAAEVVSLTVTDTADTIVYKGLSLGANDELDSAGAALDSVTVVCLAANTWYATSNSGDWVDGGVAD